MLKKVTRLLFIAAHRNELRALCDRLNRDIGSSNEYTRAASSGAIDAMDAIHLPSARRNVVGRYRTYEKFGSAHD